jgi:hypothetical protein
MRRFLTSKGMFITNNPFLYEDCSFKQMIATNGFMQNSNVNECVSVLNDKDPSATLLQSKKGSWQFEINSDEFYQVNTFYHVNAIKKRFLESLSFSHSVVHFNSTLSKAPAINYNLKDTGSYWLNENGNAMLTAYSECYLNPINAYFSPSDNSLCFGVNYEDLPGFRMVQDPTIIYHEVGHALVKVMMNMRNTQHDGFSQIVHPFKSDLGTRFYEEAGAINEGIADYFSYVMNGRTHFAEWGAGRFLNASRPISEDDHLHGPGISSHSSERLSYPTYLHYDPNEPEVNHEDIHYAGQIISHYLVALTNELKNQCSFPSGNKHTWATNYVLMTLQETLAEIGDMTARGSDYFGSTKYLTNMNPTQSYVWAHVNNPPNFKRFAQTMGKNIKHYISDLLCPQFSLNKSEQLFDDYGLLLFKHYNDNGQTFDGSENSTTMVANSLFSGVSIGGQAGMTPVNDLNRKNTVLISKDFLSLSSGAQAYVFDGQVEIANLLSKLTFQGQNVQTTPGLAGTEYNNNNIKISPGEIVGFALNVTNNSNSDMAGVQILGNDWDHMKLPEVETFLGSGVYTVNTNSSFLAPCIFNNWPLESEGGVIDSNATPQPGDCAYTSDTNMRFQDLNPGVGELYPIDSADPICLVQLRDNNETKWVSQDHFRKTPQLGLANHECLNNPSMTSQFNPNECLVRILPGAQQAIYSKLDSGKNYAQTMDQPNLDFSFKESGIMLMEVNKWVPPGTTFSCRFRARFSNCSDCYTDGNGNEYTEKEYGGHRPYKIINFQFTVID